MSALEILRSIIQDGYLSETNMTRGRTLLDTIDGAERDHEKLLSDCREEFKRGKRIEAIKRFRNETGCGLRAALNAVSDGT